MTKTKKEKETPCFKRWMRKNYAAFMSIGKEVRIGVLVVTMSIVLPETEVVGQESHLESTAKNVEIEEVEVMVDAIAPMSGIMSQNTFFKRDTQAIAPLQTVESVLAASPSIDVRQRGGKGVQADISTRGGSSDQTMVLLNGINFTDVRTGHQTHSLPIDIENVASISLLNGIVATGAYTGAINITTVAPPPNYFSAQLEAGAYGYMYSNLSGAIKKGRLSLSGSASFRKSDGYKENTEFVNYNSFAKATYYSKRSGIFDFQIGYQNRSFAANGFYSLKYTDQFEHTSTIISSAKWGMELARNLTINVSLGYRKNYDRFELIKGASDKVPYNYHNTDNISTELWISYLSFAGKSSIGTNYIYSHIFSTVLGEPLTSPHKGLCGNSVDYTKGKSRNTSDIWIRHFKSFGKISAGASIDLSLSPYGKDVMFSIEGAYKPIKDLSLTLGINRSNRLPTFTDLYYTATGYIGNTELEPEKAFNYRLTAAYANGKFSVSITPYYRQGKNIIDWVKPNADADWQSMQITKLNTFGLEAVADYHNPKSFLRDVSLTYSYISTDKSENGYISKYALDYLRHKGVAKITVSPFGGIAISAMASINKRNGNYVDNSGAVVPYNLYGLLDIRLSWSRKNITIYIDAENVTNTRYFCFAGLEMPGVWVSGGIKYTFSRNGPK